MEAAAVPPPTQAPATPDVPKHEEWLDALSDDNTPRKLKEILPANIVGDLVGLWRLAMKPDNNLGQSSVGPAGHHIGMSSALRVIAAMLAVNRSAQILEDSGTLRCEELGFLDLGSGNGLMTATWDSVVEWLCDESWAMRARLEGADRADKVEKERTSKPHCVSLGIEQDEARYNLAMRLGLVQSTCQCHHKIVFKKADFLSVTWLPDAEPANGSKYPTHIYSFDKDFPISVRKAMLDRLWTLRKVWKVFASARSQLSWTYFVRNHYSQDEDDVERQQMERFVTDTIRLIRTERVELAGSREKHTIYIYTNLDYVYTPYVYPPVKDV